MVLKSELFTKINKTEETLARLIRNEKEKVQITKIKNEKLGHYFWPYKKKKL
jgi:hypothetical protein